jgi:hypothetical protein
MANPTPSLTPTRAIIHILARGEKTSRVNYSRRMYAIIRRYTPEVAEVMPNECFTEITGLRTFFKMSYAELAQSILNDLKKEIGVSFTLRVAKASDYEAALKKSKKTKQVVTYNEINYLFQGSSFTPTEDRVSVKSIVKSSKKIRLTVPYLGKVK